MDWQLVIAINLMTLCGLTILLAFVQRRMSDWTLFIPHAAVVAVGALALWLDWPQPGTLTAGLFVPFVALPGFLMNRCQKEYLRSNYVAAARFARLAAWFHPSSDMRFNAGFIAAMAREDGGERLAAFENLRRRGNEKQRALVNLTMARIDDRWEDVLKLVREGGAATAHLQEFEIRALGELGRLDEMTEVYLKARASLQGAALRNAQLYMVAFCGRTDAIAMLANARQMQLNAETTAFWQGIAALCAADVSERERGKAVLAVLAASAGQQTMRESAARHLQQSGLQQSGLQQSGVQALGEGGRATPPASAQDAADAIVRSWIDSAPLRSSSLWRSPVTLALLAFNAAMFAAEFWYGGAEELETLVDLGAVWPPYVIGGGQWWRLVSALFVHFGSAHFAVNMFSLAVLGRFIEAVLGSLRMALIYLAGGVGSMAAVLVAMHLGYVGEGVLMGASGAIMALFGALTARQAVRWRRSRDALDLRGALVLLVVIGVQFAIDLLIPQVSFSAHASGFVLGFVLGWLLLPRVQARQPISGRS